MMDLYKNIKQQFAKGEIDFESFSEKVMELNKSGYDNIFKSKTQFKNSNDNTHGGKLVQKKVVDKKGNTVTKWVNPNSKESNKNSKEDSETSADDRKQREIEVTIDEWKNSVKKANSKSLMNASKYAVSEEVRLIARNELFRREFNPEKFVDLSLMPDFLLEDYINRYNNVKLTEKENESIDEYKDNGYFRINKGIRNETLTDKDDINIVKNLDKAISKSTLINDVVLYRGLSGKDSLYYINYLNSLKVGEIFEEPSFSSTSLKKTSADKFKNLYNSTQNISLKIYASKGQNALCMQNLGNETNKDLYSDEYEFLLPRNQKFQIIDKNDKEISIKLL